MTTRSAGARSTKAAAAASAADATTTATGSNVREAFTLMSSLIYPRIPVRYLDLCTQILQRRHMDTVFEERAVQSLCAFPACGNALSSKTGKFRISLARKEIYDAQYENKFCSQHCLQKARVLLAQLVAKPPQLVPSLLDVFGTDSPNPLAFADDSDSDVDPDQLQQTQAVLQSAPIATTVWAKTADLGVVERKATTVGLQERHSPSPPATTFPTADDAVRIEGFVFPAHKHKLAKKVETLLQTGSNDADDDDLVVSDSDESDASSIADSDATSASFALTDCDDNDVVTLDALSLFANVWRLLSSWITHATHVVVTTGQLPDVPDATQATEATASGTADDPELRAARHRMRERRNAFTHMLTRPLAATAQRVQLAADRFALDRIAAISATFELRDAIDARNAHQWTCLAALMLLVAHSKRPSDAQSGDLDHVAAFLTLETSELAQLLQLFYDVRDDRDVVVDTDTQPLEEIGGSVISDAHDTSQRDQVKLCRKCRRAGDKCVCALRRAAGDQHSVFSVSDVDAMLQEALTLRDEYDELLDHA